MTALLRVLLASSLAGGLNGFPPAHAQDASFGCKVLLCVAASTPSWSGIPYCVPVMQQLFRSLAKGGSWPTCPEGHAGGIGYEPYLPCPAGLTPISDNANDLKGASSSTNENLCADLPKAKTVCIGGDGGECKTTYPTVVRDVRSEPNFVDISTAAGSQRFYFSLKGY